MLSVSVDVLKEHLLPYLEGEAVLALRLVCKAWVFLKPLHLSLRLCFETGDAFQRHGLSLKSLKAVGAGSLKPILLSATTLTALELTCRDTTLLHEALMTCAVLRRLRLVCDRLIGERRRVWKTLPSTLREVEIKGLQIDGRALGPRIRSMDAVGVERDLHAPSSSLASGLQLALFTEKPTRADPGRGDFVRDECQVAGRGTV